MDKTRVVNIKMTKEYDVYIGRPSVFGNPFAIGPNCTRRKSLRKYQVYFDNRMKHDLLFRACVHELSGRVLACYCKPKRCHGDIIAKYLNSRRKEAG